VFSRLGQLQGSSREVSFREYLASIRPLGFCFLARAIDDQDGAAPQSRHLGDLGIGAFSASWRKSLSMSHSLDSSGR